MATPNKDPTPIIKYSLASSKRYFKDVTADGHDWISSKNNNVFSGNILRPK